MPFCKDWVTVLDEENGEGGRASVFCTLKKGHDGAHQCQYREEGMLGDYITLNWTRE